MRMLSRSGRSFRNQDNEKPDQVSLAGRKLKVGFSPPRRERCLVRLLQRGFDLAVLGVQVAAYALNDSDNGERNAGRNQAVLDGGGAGLVGEKLLENGLQLHLPRGSCWNTQRPRIDPSILKLIELDWFNSRYVGRIRPLVDPTRTHNAMPPERNMIARTASV
jgi:hypothetical protein